MTGWMVTVSVVKDDDEIGHEMYAVAIGDPAQAVKSALKAADGQAAVQAKLVTWLSHKGRGQERAALRRVAAFLTAGFEQEPGAALGLVDEGL